MNTYTLAHTQTKHIFYGQLQCYQTFSFSFCTDHSADKRTCCVHSAGPEDVLWRKCQRNKKRRTSRELQFLCWWVQVFRPRGWNWRPCGVMYVSSLSSSWKTPPIIFAKDVSLVSSFWNEVSILKTAKRVDENHWTSVPWSNTDKFLNFLSLDNSCCGILPGCVANQEKKMEAGIDRRLGETNEGGDCWHASRVSFRPRASASRAGYLSHTAVVVVVVIVVIINLIAPQPQLITSAHALVMLRVHQHAWPGGWYNALVVWRSRCVDWICVWKLDVLTAIHAKEKTRTINEFRLIQDLLVCAFQSEGGPRWVRVQTDEGSR